MNLERMLFFFEPVNENGVLTVMEADQAIVKTKRKAFVIFALVSFSFVAFFTTARHNWDLIESLSFTCVLTPLDFFILLFNTSTFVSFFFLFNEFVQVMHQYSDLGNIKIRLESCTL